MLREFLFEHPIVSLFALALIFHAINVIVINAITLPIFRLMRHLNIRARGWPPDYLDADGDWIKPEDRRKVKGFAYGPTQWIKPDSNKTSL